MQDILAKRKNMSNNFPIYDHLYLWSSIFPNYAENHRGEIRKTLRIPLFNSPHDKKERPRGRSFSLKLNRQNFPFPRQL